MKKSNFCFFKTALKSARLSPAFLFNLLCGLSLLQDLGQDKNEERGLAALRLVFAARFIIPSYQRICINYNEYLHASRFLEKYGYRTKWTNYFMDSTCGRAQLKLACKEQGFLKNYFEHLRRLNVRWYHIDQKVWLRFMMPFNSIMAATAAATSHYYRK